MEEAGSRTLPTTPTTWEGEVGAAEEEEEAVAAVWLSAT